MNAFKIAVSASNVKPGVIVDAVRGVQYRFCEYQDLLFDRDVQPSMRLKGNNCWNNAAMESLFAWLKLECIYAEDIKSKDDAY